jgi:hypothetical protein
MKTCEHEGCSNPQFGGGRCRYHQFERRKRGGDLHVRKKPIARESKKRKEESKTYVQVKTELRDAMVAKGTYNCFFSGLPMGNHFEFHHLKGRDGQLYIDPKYLVPALRKYHDDYHHLNIELLLKEPWYLEFLSKLKAIDPKLYETELKKQYKAGLFDDEF